MNKLQKRRPEPKPPSMAGMLLVLAFIVFLFAVATADPAALPTLVIMLPWVLLILLGFRNIPRDFSRTRYSVRPPDDADIVIGPPPPEGEENPRPRKKRKRFEPSWWHPRDVY